MTVIDTARVVLWLIAMAVIVAWSTVLYAWVEERRKRGRKRQMHANVAMRRRFDRELDEIRIILADLGHLDVEPVAERQPDPDPATDPVGMPPIRRPQPGPATVPAAAVIDDEWEQKRDAMVADMLAEIRGKS